MKIPNNSIGISDMLAHRDCPRRMSYGMKRHTGIGLQSDDATPEAGSYATDYGSAIHQAIEELENGATPEDAIAAAWKVWGHRLGPSDIDRMRTDLETYQTRDIKRVRTLASEDEFRVPLFVHPVYGQIYFRFKLDRLYERLDSPGNFVQVDYKSGRWAKSNAEVQEDLQMWAYNWGITEFWPECRNLVQVYDQLNYGQEVTRKSDVQREQIREWLIQTATAVLDDDQVRDDGLLKPRLNRWCAYCPIMESCPVITELTDFALIEIEALAPAEKVGRKTVVSVDRDHIEEYLERMDQAKQAITVLERFTDAVKDLIKGMPEEDRMAAGYKMKPRKKTSFTLEARRQLHERLGDDFYDLAGITKSGLESLLGDDKETLEWALALADVHEGAEVLGRA